MDEVLQRYAGKVRLVHLDFPLDGHPEAVPAARAARCAGEQGKFWEYHRGLMTRPGPLDDADLRGRAAKLRLDAAEVRLLPRLGPLRRRRSGPSCDQGAELGRHRHARLLRQRAHAVGLPPVRGVRRGDRRGARRR